MKYNGLKYDYGYISKDDYFSLCDVFTLVKYINKNNREIHLGYHNEEYLQWRNEYYIKLWESILKWIKSKYTISNYIDCEFEKDTFPGHRKERVYIGLIKMRNVYLDVIHCYSDYYVWSPFRLIEKCSNIEAMKKEVVFYRDLLENLEEHVINITNLIWQDLGENIDTYVSLWDLKQKHWFDVNLMEIQDNYFRL